MVRWSSSTGVWLASWGKRGRVSALCASGGGISFPSTATVFMNNTVVAQNALTANKTPNNIDIAGKVNSGKNNLIGDAATSGGLINGVNGNILGNKQTPSTVFIAHRMLTPANVNHVYPNDSAFSTEHAALLHFE